MPIIKIISGGQTGADRGGLEAAIHCGIVHGGWCPKGRRAEDGGIPERYTLQETGTSTYLERTEQNTIDADATIVFTEGKPTGSCLRTIAFAQRHKKPWYAVNLAHLNRSRHAEDIVSWLRGAPGFSGNRGDAVPPGNCVLNVAGSRESRTPGIEKEVKALMIDVIARLNG